MSMMEAMDMMVEQISESVPKSENEYMGEEEKSFVIPP